MKIVVYIGHPAHVHFFSQFALEMMNKGSNFIFLTRDKDVTISLLEHYNLPYVSFGKPKSGLLKKIIGLFSTSIKVFFVSLRFKPDCFVANGGIYMLFSSIFLNKPLISFSNTDIGPTLYFYKYLSDCIITPRSFKKKLGRRHIKFKGNFELAYLHPHRFQPDAALLSRYNINPNNKLILLRFVSFNAFDDAGKAGISNSEKKKIIMEMKNFGHVIVSSEDDLDQELEAYHLEKMSCYKKGDLQSLEYYASLFWGDSGAMVSESALLGTPAIYQSTKRIGFVDELANDYGLSYNYTNFGLAMQKAKELLSISDIKAIWKKKRNAYLKDKIDVTAFMVWFIKNHPKSKQILQENPDFQNRFITEV